MVKEPIFVITDTILAAILHLSVSVIFRILVVGSNPRWDVFLDYVLEDIFQMEQ